MRIERCRIVFKTFDSKKLAGSIWSCRSVSGFFNKSRESFKVLKPVKEDFDKNKEKHGKQRISRRLITNRHENRHISSTDRTTLREVVALLHQGGTSSLMFAELLFFVSECKGACFGPFALHAADLRETDNSKLRSLSVSPMPASCLSLPIALPASCSVTLLEPLFRCLS